MTGNPLKHLFHFLTPARIARYRSFLKLTTNEEVRRAYAWNYAISAMVFPLLGCVEMHLRDAVHRVMSQRYAPAGAANHHGYPWYDDQQAHHYPFAKQAPARAFMHLNFTQLMRPEREAVGAEIAWVAARVALDPKASGLRRSPIAY